MHRKLPESIAQIEAMGVSYSRSSSLEDVEDPDEEMERSAADEFMYETEHLAR